MKLTEAQKQRLIKAIKYLAVSIATAIVNGSWTHLV